MFPRLRHLRVIWVTTALAVLIAGVVYWCLNKTEKLTAEAPPVDPEAALVALREGNTRFVNSARTLSTDSAHDADHRHITAQGQHPFVAVLCCSDSRLCPEFIFDQRTGSIFEIRNAGNVVDDDVLATLEYAVDHFHIPLVLVLGHKGCGAIKAVAEAGDKPLHDHLREIQKHMNGIRGTGALSQIGNSPEMLDRLSQENAKQQAKSLLQESHVIKEAVEAGRTRVIYGLYDMETGRVEFFDINQ